MPQRGYYSSKAENEIELCDWTQWMNKVKWSELRKRKAKEFKNSFGGGPAKQTNHQSTQQSKDICFLLMIDWLFVCPAHTSIQRLILIPLHSHYAEINQIFSFHNLILEDKGFEPMNTVIILNNTKTIHNNEDKWNQTKEKRWRAQQSALWMAFDGMSFVVGYELRSSTALNFISKNSSFPFHQLALELLMPRRRTNATSLFFNWMSLD